MNRITSALIATLLTLGLSLPASAGPFEDGQAAYDRADYATALRLWTPLAAQGNALVFCRSDYDSLSDGVG